MKRIKLVSLALVGCLAMATPALAQNREHMQMFGDLRMLQEQLARVQQAINLLAEQLKSTNARVDAQGNETRKGFADQKVAIDAIAGTVRVLTEKESESSVRVAQFATELKSIRDGLVMQQTMLNEILNLLQPAPLPGVAGDPAAAAAGGTVPPRPGGTVPPSPAAYYNQIFGYYASNQFDFAIEAAEAALKQFPDAPQAPRAQMTIGDSYLALGKNREALAAFTALISKYPSSEEVPEAYYRQGLAYQALGQKEQARKSYNKVITDYPNSLVATLAATALKKMGGAPLP